MISRICLIIIDLDLLYLWCDFFNTIVVYNLTSIDLGLSITLLIIFSMFFGIFTYIFFKNKID